MLSSTHFQPYSVSRYSMWQRGTVPDVLVTAAARASYSGRSLRG